MRTPEFQEFPVTIVLREMRRLQTRDFDSMYLALAIYNADRRLKTMEADAASEGAAKEALAHGLREDWFEVKGADRFALTAKGRQLADRVRAAGVDREGRIVVDFRDVVLAMPEVRLVIEALSGVRTKLTV